MSNIDQERSFKVAKDLLLNMFYFKGAQFLTFSFRYLSILYKIVLLAGSTSEFFLTILT